MTTLLHAAANETKSNSPGTRLRVRFMLSIKSECLDRMIFFGEKSLRNATVQFIEHYHSERNHQGLDNKIIDPGPDVGRADGDIECRERLGGLLNYYHRRAI